MQYTYNLYLSNQWIKMASCLELGPDDTDTPYKA